MFLPLAALLGYQAGALPLLLLASVLLMCCMPAVVCQLLGWLMLCLSLVSGGYGGACAWGAVCTA